MEPHAARMSGRVTATDSSCPMMGAATLMSLADVQLATKCQTMVAYIPIVGSTLVRNYCTYADHSIQHSASSMLVQNGVIRWW